MVLLGHAADSLAGATVPQDVADALRLGRMVALTKPTGGVRGLIMGDVFRRLVARTLAQQFGDKFWEACAPFQYALSTRAGSEAVVRALRAATETDPRTTVLSIDGVEAYDHISRASMLEALRTHEPLTGLLPFAAMFYGQASRYVYYDEAGVRHEVLQGEGGEQGDPLMPGRRFGPATPVTAPSCRSESSWRSRRRSPVAGRWQLALPTHRRTSRKKVRQKRKKKPIASLPQLTMCVPPRDVTMCASPRPTTRSAVLLDIAGYAPAHDDAAWETLQACLGGVADGARKLATLRASLGGLGLAVPRPQRTGRHGLTHPLCLASAP